MECARVAPVFVTICLLVTIPVDSQSPKQNCDTGWFGSKCQFKCHCRDNNCDADGECVGTARCEKGWFGPACQYVDLMVTHSKLPTPWWLRNSDPTICNPETGILPQTVNITLEEAQHITWLRLHLNRAGLEQEFILNFSTSSSDVRVQCPHRITTESLVSSKLSEIVDIFCDHNEPVESVILSGKAVGFFCSLFISGGRNVALRENTVQTSTRVESIDQTVQESKGIAPFSYSSSLAVDGNTSGNWNHKSCSHTIGDNTDLKPNWDVIFSEPKIISRYVIYNRVSACCSDRLQGFILSAYDKEDKQLFQYQDKNLTGTLRVYSVLPSVPTTPVTRVNIQATLTDYRWPTPTLTLCEVELFGDSVCPLGKYGRDCERTCDCAGENQACFVNTGKCVSGCDAGRELDGCSLDSDQKTSQLSNVVVIGVVAGTAFTVLVFIVLVGVYCYRLRNSTQKSRPGYDDLHFDRQEEHNYNTIGDADLLHQNDGYILPVDVRYTYSENPPLPPRSREQNTVNNDSGETGSAAAYITVLEDPRHGHSAGVYDQPTNSVRDRRNANAPSDSSRDRADDYAYAEWEEYVELEDVLSDAETDENTEAGQLEKS